MAKTPEINVSKDGYLVSDTGWWLRMWFALLCAVLALFVAPFLMLILGSFWGVLIGIDVWIILLAYALPFFSASVPEIAGLIVLNILRRPTKEDRFANLCVFPTGFHPKFPWERRLSYIDLRQGKVPIAEDFPAGNGVLVKFTGSIFFQPLIRWLPVYIAVNMDTIVTAIREIATSWLSDQVQRKETPEEAREALSSFQKRLQRHFEKAGRDPKTFEQRYGIDVVLARLGDVGYGDAYTKALDDRATGERIQNMAQNFQQSGVAPKDAMNAALLVAGKNVKKEIVEVEGLQPAVNAITGTLVRIFGRTAPQPPAQP